MGWVIVEFPETREVFVDDETQGPNRDSGGQPIVLFVEDGRHTFRLGGGGVAPPAQDATVKATSILDPLHVVFTKA
jgi:hypothetical protein